MICGSIEPMPRYYRDSRKCSRCWSGRINPFRRTTVCEHCKSKNGGYDPNSSNQLRVRQWMAYETEQNEAKRTDTITWMLSSQIYVPIGDTIDFRKIVNYDYDFSFEHQNYSKWKRKIIRRAKRRQLVSNSDGKIVFTIKVFPKFLEQKEEKNEMKIEAKPVDDSFDYTQHWMYSELSQTIGKIKEDGYEVIEKDQV